jgi:hypothetical protein
MRLRPLLLLLLLLMALSGCSLVYDHRIESDSGVLYSDHPAAVTDRYMQRLEWSSRGIGEYLPEASRNVGDVTVILSGTPADSGAVIRRGSVGFAGWYNSLLDIIWLSGAPDEDGNSILLEADSLDTFQHELAHHLTSQIPGIEGRWWLVEGIACHFEGGFDPGDGSFAIPPLHIKYYDKCRRELRRRGRTQFLGDLLETIEGDYGKFYGTDSELLYRYALSWGFLWHLLNQSQSDVPFEAKLTEIIEMETKELLVLAPGFVDDLETRARDQIQQYLEDPRLRRWAIEGAIGQFRSDGTAISDALDEELSKSSNPIWAWCRVVELIGSRSSRWSRSLRSEWVQRFFVFMESATTEQKKTICREVVPSSRSFSIIEVIVDCLESPDGELRALAAESLARISRQKTIVNPRFWIDAPAGVRQAEIDSWRDYLNRN